MVKKSIARSVRQDPVQEALIQRKDRVNARVSEIIRLWIEAKRAWNGKPAPYIGIPEPGSIREPLPDEVKQTVSKIVDLTNQAAGEVNEIDSHQKLYSQNRTKVNINKNTSKEPLNLETLASNRFTRFLSHVKTPFSDGLDKWFHLKLLRSSASIERHLKDIESSILSKKEMSIPNALYHAKDLYFIIENDLIKPILSKSSFFSTHIKSDKPEEDKDYKNFKNKLINNSKKNLKNIDKEDSTRSEIDLKNIDFNTDEAQQLIVDIYFGLSSIRKELDSMRGNSVDSKIKNTEFIRRINLINSELDNRNLNNAIRMYFDLRKDYANYLNESDNFSIDEEDNIEKEASNFGRWLKHKNIKYLTHPDDRKRSLRLSIKENIDNSKKMLNKLMDSLETQNLSIISMIYNLEAFLNTLPVIYNNLSKIAEIHNSEARMSRYDSRMDGDKPDVDLISMVDIREVLKISRNIENLINKLNENLKSFNE